MNSTASLKLPLSNIS